MGATTVGSTGGDGTGVSDLGCMGATIGRRNEDRRLE
jgi:hypothetical protein